ncbi:pentatricopeptide repeat-containing protein [Striga asiatica]|uniref:Pentatricopeptide repeat-containing protein n=1 Tax=Striga asiatica TaxID=4170 RepID=A0A5A7QJY7_STRAF|nr:pentatricopeptide repeat-containing protein [Striga asiatica]
MESKNIFPDLFTYNTLISMYCKKAMHYEALCVQERMKISGISPDIVTYNLLIYSYSREGRVREALRLFKEIKGGVLPNHMGSAELAFNAILRRLCEEGRIQDANRLLNEMGERKIEPDNVTCNTLINAYCKIGDMRSALKVKGKMIEGGLRPDQFMYRALVHGFCKVREVNNAKEMLFDMIRAGFFPSSCTYAWLVDFYCGDNDFDGILRLPAELAGKGILVDVSVYRAIIRRLCKRERVDCAEKVFMVMQEMGILGDTVICANMAYAYFRGGDGSSFSAFLDEMYRRRLMVTLKIFRNINASYANDRDCLDMFWSALLDRGLISKSKTNRCNNRSMDDTLEELLLQDCEDT